MQLISNVPMDFSLHFWYNGVQNKRLFQGANRSRDCRSMVKEIVKDPIRLKRKARDAAP